MSDEFVNVRVPRVLIDTYSNEWSPRCQIRFFDNPAGWQMSLRLAATFAPGVKQPEKRKAAPSRAGRNLKPKGLDE